MNENVNLQDILLTKLPENKKLIVFSYGDICQNETNFNIPLIFKELQKDEPKYYLCFFNLKEICAFPLGAVVENQHKNGSNAGIVQDFQIIIGDGLLETKNINDIPILDEFMNSIPDKIGKYNVRWHKNQQKYSTFVDSFSKKIIIFPHYEIARYFYFTSASMTKQIMSESQNQNSSLDGLYKRAVLNKGNGEIYLKFNANNSDAENIFRFIMDQKANNMWHQVRRDMVASKILSEQKKRDYNFENPQGDMTIQANFPVSGRINFRARVKKFSDGSFLVLRILQEDTFYPFTKLKVFRELSSRKDDIVGVIKNINPLKRDLTNCLNTKNPNHLYSPVNIIDQDGDASLEAKLDLLNKTIQFETSLGEDYNKEIVRSNNRLLNNKLDLSSNDAETHGDLNVAKGYFKKEDIVVEQEIVDYITLEDLKIMLLYCSDIYENFSYKILQCEYLPQKPKNYRGRYAWKRSKMLDGVTPRKYIVVEIDYKNCRYIIIEIQKDKLVDALSTLVIIDYNNSVDEYILKEIVINIAKTSNSWLQNLKFEITKHFLYHPYDTQKEKIQDWGKRLKYVLDKFQKNS